MKKSNFIFHKALLSKLVKKGIIDTIRRVDGAFCFMSRNKPSNLALMALHESTLSVFLVIAQIAKADHKRIIDANAYIANYQLGDISNYLGRSKKVTHASIKSLRKMGYLISQGEKGENKGFSKGWCRDSISANLLDQAMALARQRNKLIPNDIIEEKLLYKPNRSVDSIVKEALINGASPKDIMSKYGLKKNYFYACLSRIRKDAPSSFARLAPEGPPKYKIIYEEYLGGANRESLCKKYNISRSSLSGFLYRAKKRAKSSPTPTPEQQPCTI
jgi:hypothetical protein